MYPLRIVIRRKRAQVEYTRWRATDETTQEFIVKVLDDELTTPNTNPIVAINIQPVTKVAENIIVGGVIVPPLTTVQGHRDESRDYTRFVHPIHTLPVSRVDEMFLAPQFKDVEKLPTIKPKGRNSQRDESPPASPQFLLRTSTLFARQFAPVDPVSFTRRSTVSPRKPTSSHNIYEDSEFSPTRTTDSWLKTTKPEAEEMDDIQNLLKHDVNDIATRSTLENINAPLRTTAREEVIDETGTSVFLASDLKNSNGIDNSKASSKKISMKDPESTYNEYYAEENVNKKGNQEFGDAYDVKEASSDSDTNNDSEINKNLTKIELEMDYEEENDSSDDLNSSTQNTMIYSNFKYLPKHISSHKPLQDCNIVKLKPFNFNSPPTLAEIFSQLKHWAETSPLVKWEDITKGNLTIMDNPIHVMIVDDPSSGQIVSAKQTVMIVAGIQGRDHHAVTAAMYVLHQLIERSESHLDILRKYRFWIIPVFNPDGYDYSLTFPRRREWSKNLRQNWEVCRHRDSCSSCELFGLRCAVQPCYGVNLDRNFEYQWIPAEELRSEYPCGSLYAGERQLSEPETSALTHFLHEKRTLLFTFIAFKEGDVLGVMYPYSHTRKLRAFDHVYRHRASRAAAAVSGISDRTYVAGQTSEFLPLYAGGIEDWVDGHLGIDNTYTIMMFRPTDSYNSKLITERVVHEAYAAMDTLLLQSVEPLDPPIMRQTKVNSSERNTPLLFMIIYLMFL